MEWTLNYHNNHQIIVKIQELKGLGDSKLEGTVRHSNGYINLPCSLEISNNSDFINGLSFKIDNNPIKYILKIKPELQKNFYPGYRQEILLNKNNETLTLLVE